MTIGVKDREDDPNCECSFSDAMDKRDAVASKGEKPKP
eukprot:SAG31_NODE_42908_length_269_cov_0.917647_1_plen_37_part_10